MTSKQAEKLKSCKMKDEGWNMNDERLKVVLVSHSGILGFMTLIPKEN